MAKSIIPEIPALDNVILTEKSYKVPQFSTDTTTILFPNIFTIILKSIS